MWLAAVFCLLLVWLHTWASSCARPATRDEMTRGRMSILSILIKISPGKEINMIVSSVNSPYLRNPPTINPPITLRTVRTRSRFSPIHPLVCLIQWRTEGEARKKSSKNKRCEDLFTLLDYGWCDRDFNKMRKEEEKKKKILGQVLYEKLTGWSLVTGLSRAVVWTPFPSFVLLAIPTVLSSIPEYLH